MAASTCSAWTSWATSNWTAAARNCSSRCSPNGKRRHRSRSLPTQRSASGPAPSPTHACAPRSSTGSPSTPTSSKPAASLTGSRPLARGSRKPPQQALHGTVHSRHRWTATKRGGHHGHTPHQPADLRPRRHQHRNRQGQLPPDRHPAQPLPRLPHHRQPDHPQRAARIPHRQGTLTPHRGRLVHRHAQPQGPQRQHLPRPHPHHHTLTPDWPTARWGHFKLLHRGQLRLTQPDAVGDLREVIGGIHPPVLDNGLEAAIATLAARSPVPVDAHVEIVNRPSAAIETIVYFCVAELLTNVAKHSAATQARIEATQPEGRLRLVVTDDGRGGAAGHGAVAGGGAGGTGLPGLADRIATVDGALDIASPPGGPTVITVDLPLQ